MEYGRFVTKNLVTLGELFTFKSKNVQNINQSLSR